MHLHNIKFFSCNMFFVFYFSLIFLLSHLTVTHSSCIHIRIDHEDRVKGATRARDGDGERNTKTEWRKHKTKRTFSVLLLLAVSRIWVWLRLVSFMWIVVVNGSISCLRCALCILMPYIESSRTQQPFASLPNREIKRKKQNSQLFAWMFNEQLEKIKSMEIIQ